MTEFVLKNNVIEFSRKVLRQMTKTAIDTAFNTAYAKIYIDRTE